MLAPFLHYLFFAFPIMYVVLGGSSKFYDFVLAYIILMQFHWNLFDRECICSYIQKKMKDCSYKLGFNSGAPGMNDTLTDIIGYLTSLTGLYLTHKLGYNLYIYIVLTTLWTFATILDSHIPVLLPIAQLYFLKDNRYLIPGVSLLFVLSVGVRAMDKKMCPKAPHVHPSNVIVPSDNNHHDD